MLGEGSLANILELKSWTNYTLAGVSLLVLVKAAQYLASPARRLPPSPPADPIIGHGKLISTSHTQKIAKYAELVKALGDVFCLKVPGSIIIVLNSFAAARELLDKQSASFSDRPYVPVMEMIGWGDATPSLSYGNTLREQRRMMLKYLNVVSSTSGTGRVQQTQVARFLKRLLITPESFRDLVHVLVSGTMVEVVYGHRVTTTDDIYVKLSDRAVELGSQIGTLGGTIIDILPFLRHFPAWLPGMGVKRHALKVREAFDRVIDAPFQEAKERKAAGDAFSSMVSDLLDGSESQEAGDGHEYVLKQTAFSVYNAGSDTTTGTILTFFMMMTLHPEVLAKAQREVDSVIGTDPERLPMLEDQKDLPYIECIVKELYRANPPAPFGIPHSSTQDVQFRDWEIPRGSVAMPNIWQMVHDERFFPDPDAFRPDRFKASARSGGVDSNEIQGADDPSVLVFGFGRRACPGKTFAESIIFVTLASMIATFDIKPYVDPNTCEEMLPEVAYRCNVSSAPIPFKCTIVPRSARHAQLVQELNMD